MIEANRAAVTDEMKQSRLWLATYMRSLWRPRDCAREQADPAGAAVYRCQNTIHGLIMPLESEFAPWSQWTFWQFSEGKWQDEAFRRRHAVGDEPVDVSFFGGSRESFRRMVDAESWTCDPAVAVGL